MAPESTRDEGMESPVLGCSHQTLKCASRRKGGARTQGQNLRAGFKGGGVCVGIQRWRYQNLRVSLMKRWGHNSNSSWERPAIADKYSLAVALLDIGDLSILRGGLYERYVFAP